MGNPQQRQEHPRGTVAVGDPYQSEDALQNEGTLKGLQLWVLGHVENQREVKSRKQKPLDIQPKIFCATHFLTEGTVIE